MARCVMIEVVESSSVAAAALSGQLVDLPGLRIDPSFQPIPLTLQPPAPGSVLLRGELEDAAAAKACAHPAVIALWSDPLLAAARLDRKRPAIDRLSDAIGACHAAMAAERRRIRQTASAPAGLDHPLRRKLREAIEAASAPAAGANRPHPG